MASNTATAQSTLTVAHLFLATLAEAGVDYLFAVLGSDHPSILEAYLDLQKHKRPCPKMLHFQHEFVAISAADGYGRLTAKPQCVLVHTDVGTLACGQGLHNASSGRAPMLIFAGLAPGTLNGELLGSRSEHVHWYQDVPGQAAIVAPYTRYCNEIRSAEQVRVMVQRALLMASTGSPGPSYLTAAREVLASRTNIDIKDSMPSVPSMRLGGLPADAVAVVGDALLFAERPLVCTGYLGRNHDAVDQLGRLVELVGGLQVLDAELREMSFLAANPAWVTDFMLGPDAVRVADVVLVLDADVPWVPTKAAPPTAARIFHIDIDPRKERMLLFDVHAEASFQAECNEALKQLLAYISQHQGLAGRQALFHRRSSDIARRHLAATEWLRIRTFRHRHGHLSVERLFDEMHSILPSGTTFVHDAVTNTTRLLEQLQLNDPGTCIGKGGSGLGWAGGAAIGARLALDKYDVSDRPRIKPRDPGTSPPGMVCCVTGDGAFVFGNPTATYWAQHHLNTPFLTVLINNGGWKATRASIKDVHPNGIAAGTSDANLGIDLSRDGPDYAGVAVAASNGTLWSRKVSDPADLHNVLTQAVAVVHDERRGALVEVVISWID